MSFQYVTVTQQLRGKCYLTAPLGAPCMCKLCLSWAKQSPPFNCEWCIDGKQLPSWEPTRKLWTLRVCRTTASGSSRWPFDEPRFSLLPDIFEGFALVPVSLPFSWALELLPSSFFVLRKRPPQPLALFMACRWRDSWRYGCKKWLKYYSWKWNTTLTQSPYQCETWWLWRSQKQSSHSWCFTVHPLPDNNHKYRNCAAILKRSLINLFSDN